MEKELVQYKDTIMLGSQPWDIEIGSNFKNMALEISKNSRVLYVNKPLDRITALTKSSDIKTINRQNSIRNGIGVLNEIKENLFVFNPQILLESVNWLPPGKVYRFFNHRNNKKLATQIKFACNKLGFNNTLLIIDNDFHNGLYLKELLNINCVVYYLRDYLLSQPYFYKHGVISEPLILQKVEIVATNSLYLAAYAQKYNPNTYYIGQGCEVEEFERLPDEFPSDIRNIKKPVIGYCGALLSLRLDIDLLISIAIQRPHWNLVLVGPEDADFKKSKLHNLSNVYFLGSKEPNELPSYVHYFDVCINPQVVNQMTIGNYPRKIDEYLAAGKPVVATYTQAMEEFINCTYLCKDLQGYLSAIEKAILESNDMMAASKRIQVARSHTWHNSILKLYSAIKKYSNTIGDAR